MATFTYVYGMHGIELSINRIFGHFGLLRVPTLIINEVNGLFPTKK